MFPYSGQGLIPLRAALNKYKLDGENLPGRFTGEAEKLSAEFEGLRKRTFEAAEKRDVNGNAVLSGRLKGLLDGRGLLVVIENAQGDLRRYRAAKEFLESTAGEAWLGTRKS